MTGSAEPLLPPNQQGGGNDGDSRDHHADEIALRLEAGLDDDDDIDFEGLLHSRPDKVLEYLAEQGARKLGSFITEDTEVLPLMQDGNIWTFGSDNLDIDYERAWRHYLANDNFKAKGFPSKVEVEAWAVALRNAALPDDRGVLNPLIEKWQDGAISTKVFGLPAVHAVIQFKWDKWARRVLIYEFLTYLVWLLSFQVFIIAFQDEDLNLSVRELWGTHRGRITMVSLITSLIGMLPFVYIEGCTVWEYGPSRWFSAQNAVDLLTYLFQVAIAVCYFARIHHKSDALSILAALQVLLLWWRIQYFARAFQGMSNSFLNTIVAVIQDVKWFLLLLVITLWGFAGAWYILYRDEQTKKFDNPWHAMLTVFTMMEDPEADFFLESKKPVMGCIMLVVFVFVISMILLDLLISLMAASAEKATDDDGTKYLCSKAELIDELETSLPAWLRSPDWTPAHIHVLKVNPRSRTRVGTAQLWAKSAEEEDENGQEELKKQVEEMREEMRGEISELKAMLRAALEQNGVSSAKQ